MQPAIRQYLEDVRTNLHLPPVKERQIIGELYSHFQEKVKELQSGGAGEREAAAKAIEGFGKARVIARLMYEAHSRGSFRDVLMICLPHMVVGGLFLFHVWDNVVLAPLVFSGIVAITLLGWWRSKPNWLYSWMGYALVPILVVGLAASHVPGQTFALLFTGRADVFDIIFGLLVISFYLASAWLIVSMTVRVVRRDWLLASLMLVPMPIIGCWLFNIQATANTWSAYTAHQWDGLMASCLLVVGITASTFIRLRERRLKIAALVTLGSMCLTFLAYNLWGDLGFIGLVAFSGFMLVFLLAPALLEARLGHGEKDTETWWQEMPEGNTSLPN